MRAYYLGRSSREPAQPLSEVFDPMRGPILRYFVQTVRTINRTPFIERFCRTDAFREFRQASEATLEELRLLAIQLAMCLGVPDKVHPMDALTATVAHIFVLDIKTIPALSHLTNQPRHKFLNLLLEITRLFTFKGVPLIGERT